ncbi:MAG: sigma-54-dependent transcriptional regulator [Planctomycetota bacterium]
MNALDWGLAYQGPSRRPDFDYGQTQTVAVARGAGVSRTLVSPGRWCFQDKELCLVSSSSLRILIVDDQTEVRTYVRRVLEEKGYEVLEAPQPSAGLAVFEREVDTLSLVILDLDLGAGVPDGLELLRSMKRIQEAVPVLILTGKGTASSGAEAIRLGAADVLEKDLYIEESLEASVEKIQRLQNVVGENRRLAAENVALRRTVDYYTAEFRRRYTMVGDSPAFRSTIEESKRVANVPRPVLIRGERGTGKELIAALIHYHSDRRDRPFVTVNCAAFHGNLLESEMFGHEKGAFTGADKRKVGRFELANGGTLFLDEVGNMPMDFQEKVLRVLEYQKFERVAGTETIAVDVRVVAATNSNLEQMMEAGTFRPDLYDRLAFKEIRLPPLRDRGEDIPLLVEHFRQQLTEEIPWVARRMFTPEAVEMLQRHAWPGNIRQLKNVVERLLCASESPRIAGTEVALEIGDRVDTAHTFQDKVAQLELQLIMEALQRAGGNQRLAAESMGLTYDQFRHLFKKYRIKDRVD